MKISISIKLSILIAILSFIIAFSLGKYANDISTKELETKTFTSLQNLSTHISEVLDREMLERYREMKFASSMDILSDEKTTIEDKRAFLEQIKLNQKHHEWIGFALPDGTIQVGTNGYLEGKNVKARPWFPGGLNGPYIGDVHDALLLAKLLPNTSGEAIYFTDIGFPVKNKNGEVIGVLCSHLTWQWTRDIIRSIEKDHNIDIYLLSKNNMILVGPNDSERKQLSEISQNAVKELNEKNVVKIIDWEFGKRYLTSQTISKGFEEYTGFGWKIIVRENVKNAFKEIKDNTSKLLIFSLVASVFGALIGIFIVNLIIAPLRELNNQIPMLKDNKEIEFDKNISTKEIFELQEALKSLQHNLLSETKLKNEAEDKIKISLQIFDQSLEGIIITDKENNIILVNKAFTQITGYELNEIYGKNPSILNSGKYDSDFYKKMWEEIKTHGKWSGKLVNKRKSGEFYEEYLKISTIKDENGNIVNYLATFNSGF